MHKFPPLCKHTLSPPTGPLGCSHSLFLPRFWIPLFVHLSGVWVLSLLMCSCCSLQPMDLHMREEAPIPQVPHAHLRYRSPLVSPWTYSPLSKCRLLTVPCGQVVLIWPRLRLQWHEETTKQGQTRSSQPEDIFEILHTKKSNRVRYCTFSHPLLKRLF